MAPLWGNSSNTADAPTWMPLAGCNANGITLLANLTVGAFKNNESVGVFGVDNANTENSQGVISPGWQLVTHGTGPVTTVTVTSGTGLTNGETFKITNNVSTDVVINATGYITTGTPNIATITYGGSGFSNVATTKGVFNRERHLAYLRETGGVGTGYYATDYIVVSGTGVLVNAVCTLSGVNAIGGFGNANVVISSVGLFTNTAANATLTVTVLAANGAASNGSGAVLYANVAASTGGTLTVTALGGRSGRVQSECLVTAHLTNSTALFPSA